MASQRQTRSLSLVGQSFVLYLWFRLARCGQHNRNTILSVSRRFVCTKCLTCTEQYFLLPRRLLLLWRRGTVLESSGGDGSRDGRYQRRPRVHGRDAVWGSERVWIGSWGIQDWDWGILGDQVHLLWKHKLDSCSRYKSREFRADARGRRFRTAVIFVSHEARWGCCCPVSCCRTGISLLPPSLDKLCVWSFWIFWIFVRFVCIPSFRCLDFRIFKFARKCLGLCHIVNFCNIPDFWVSRFLSFEIPSPMGVKIVGLCQLSKFPSCSMWSDMKCGKPLTYCWLRWTLSAHRTTTIRKHWFAVGANALNCWITALTMDWLNGLSSCTWDSTIKCCVVSCFMNNQASNSTMSSIIETKTEGKTSHVTTPCREGYRLEPAK